MSLIDADVLFQHKVVGEIGNISGDFVPGFAIAQAPTIDAVEVVRCAQCVSYRHAPVKHCVLCGTQKEDDDYCSCGERRKPDGE